MDVRHIGSIALLAIMAVAALFFFPAAHGSYSSTHGPITAVRSLRLRAILFFVIAAAAAALSCLLRAMISFGYCRMELAPVPSFASRLDAAPLRC